MDYNTNVARESLTRLDAFGDSLKNDANFKLTSPQTPLYNCIAFAMGMKDRWVDTCPLPWHWWPPVSKGSRESDLVDAFAFFGFIPCGMDDSIECGYDKVALYHNHEGWTHAARIIGDGVYHSKFGSSYDGYHSRGDVLSNLYGTPYLIMKRAQRDAHLTEDRKGMAPGVIHTRSGVFINGEYNHIVSYGGKFYLGNHGQEIRINGDKIEFVK